ATISAFIVRLLTLAASLSLPRIPSGKRSRYLSAASLGYGCLESGIAMYNRQLIEKINESSRYKVVAQSISSRYISSHSNSIFQESKYALAQGAANPRLLACQELHAG